MARCLLSCLMVLMASSAMAQEVKGPQINSVFVEAFPVSDSLNKTIVTADYNIKLIEVGKLKVTVLGFVDLEPQAKQRFYFTNNDQVMKWGAVPIGVMFEEAADRVEKENNRIARFGRVGPVANLNDVAGARKVSKTFAKVLNVSWLKAAYGNIADEMKIYMVTKDVPVGIGWLSAEGFYRIRYGPRSNFGQPQINFRPRGLPRLKLICEIEQSGRNVDIYLGARIMLVKH